MVMSSITSTLKTLGMSNLLRFARPIADSPAVYARPGYVDHRLLCQLLSEGRAGFSGVVFDPTAVEEQSELLRAINGKNLWSVLDPKALELSTVGGFTGRRKLLPWAGARPHVLADFEADRGQQLAEKVVEFVLENKYSALLCPTHYLDKGFSDPWLKIDLAMFEAIRGLLDKAGGKDVALYYPLCVPTAMFFDAAQRIALKLAFKASRTPDALWLRVHPFGGGSGHVTLESYIRACRDLQELGVPLVGEKVGALGLALLAFGALGGLDLGVSSGEGFDALRLLKKTAKSKPFAPHRGVLVEALGLSLDAKSAKAFFENRNLRGQYGCRDTSCCRGGYADTLKEPRRHFVISRLAEIDQIGVAPYQERPQLFLEKVLRPATDKLSRVAQFDIPAPVKKKVQRQQHKMAGWRNTLGEMSRVPLMSPAKVPSNRVERLRGAA